MACTLTRPDPQTLFERLRNMFSVTVLGGAPVIPESNEHYVVSNDVAVVETVYAFTDQLTKDADPATACCESLIAMAAQRGVYPRPASFSEGYVIIRGTAGTTLPNSVEIATTSGNYRSVGTVPGAISSDGTAIVRVRALVPGSAGNSAGTITTGTLVTSIAGVDTTVEICGGSLCGGGEAEGCEQFRQRYLSRLAYQPRATQAFIMQQFLEWPCATRVYPREGECCKCDPICGDCGCQDCGGKNEFYVLFDGAFPCAVPPQNVVDDINVWMFGEHLGYGEGQVEMGVCGRVVAPIAVLIDLNLDIAGCITASQKALIEEGMRDLFASVPPSKPVKSLQMRVVIANVIGAGVNTDIRATVVNAADASHVTVTDCCGDIEPACDYLPCLRNITFTSPEGGRGAGDCA